MFEHELFLKKFFVNELFLCSLMTINSQTCKGTSTCNTMSFIKKLLFTIILKLCRTVSIKETPYLKKIYEQLALLLGKFLAIDWRYWYKICITNYQFDITNYQVSVVIHCGPGTLTRGSKWIRVQSWIVTPRNDTVVIKIRKDSLS